VALPVSLASDSLLFWPAWPARPSTPAMTATDLRLHRVVSSRARLKQPGGAGSNSPVVVRRDRVGHP
jgi:hypothetical protein